MRRAILESCLHPIEESLFRKLFRVSVKTFSKEVSRIAGKKRKSFSGALAGYYEKYLCSRDLNDEVNILSSDMTTCCGKRNDGIFFEKRMTTIGHLRVWLPNEIRCVSQGKVKLSLTYRLHVNFILVA